MAKKGTVSLELFAENAALGIRQGSRFLYVANPEFSMIIDRPDINTVKISHDDWELTFSRYFIDPEHPHHVPHPVPSTNRQGKLTLTSCKYQQHSIYSAHAAHTALTSVLLGNTRTYGGSNRAESGEWCTIEEDGGLILTQSCIWHGPDTVPDFRVDETWSVDVDSEDQRNLQMTYEASVFPYRPVAVSRWWWAGWNGPKGAMAPLANHTIQSVELGLIGHPPVETRSFNNTAVDASEYPKHPADPTAPRYNCMRFRFQEISVACMSGTLLRAQSQDFGGANAHLCSGYWVEPGVLEGVVHPTPLTATARTFVYVLESPPISP